MRAAVVAETYPSRADSVLGVWAHRRAVAVRDADAESASSRCAARSRRSSSRARPGPWASIHVAHGSGVGRRASVTALRSAGAVLASSTWAARAGAELAGTEPDALAEAAR